MYTNRSKLTLWYWKIPGRASTSYVLFKAGNVGVNYIDDDEEEVKETYWGKAPFGQLPYLIDSERGVEMAQSAAIVAYAARIAKLDGGDNLLHYSQTLMYLELEAELTGFLGKALYTGASGSDERKKAWVDARGKIVEKLNRVKNNLGDKKFMGDTSSPLAADYCIATTFWLVSLILLFIIYIYYYYYYLLLFYYYLLFMI